MDLNCVIKDVKNVKIEINQAKNYEFDPIQLKNAFDVTIAIPKSEIDN
jgi:hypothetical protein